MKKMSALKEAKEIYSETRKEIEIAYEIAKKVDPLLPPNWESAFIIGGWRGLLFSVHEEAPAMDLKLVCSIVEKVTGLEVKKDSYVHGDYLMWLSGSVKVPIEEGHDLQIYIRHCQPKDCELTIEEKMVKIATVSDDCLGLGK